MKKGKKINWTVYFLELVIVILGILIAFGLNSWNENRKQKQIAKSYLLGLKEEIDNNKVELISTLKYHNKLLSSLRNAPSSANLTLNPAPVSNAAWLARSNIIRDHVDPELFSKIVLIYQAHENLVSHTQSSSDKMSEINVMGPFYLLNGGKELSVKEKEELEVELKKGWIPIFESWIAIEEIYIERIDDAFKYWQHSND